MYYSFIHYLYNYLALDKIKVTIPELNSVSDYN